MLCEAVCMGGGAVLIVNGCLYREDRLQVLSLEPEALLVYATEHHVGISRTQVREAIGPLVGKLFGAKQRDSIDGGTGLLLSGQVVRERTNRVAELVESIWIGVAWNRVGRIPHRVPLHHNIHIVRENRPNRISRGRESRVRFVAEEVHDTVGVESGIVTAFPTAVIKERNDLRAYAKG